MDQIEFNDTTLVLKVKKSNLFVRTILYVITFLAAALPLGGFVVNFVNEGAFKFFNLIFLLLFGLVFFYMLRISLWNTCGKEVIKIMDKKLQYTADYHWFKNRVKEFSFKEIQFTLRQVGYEEDNKGVLVINFDNEATLETVTKLDLVQLNTLISQLSRNSNSN
ncbi:hypothetical protein [Myroides odoratus]|uniref:hypothetical protein n=1 Tax=Myroides odoratus TaxID=256 RepID=UPI0039B09D2B